GEQGVQVRVDRGDVIARSSLLSPLRLQVIDADHGEAGLAIGGQVRVVHDAAGTHDGDGIVTARGHRDVCVHTPVVAHGLSSIHTNCSGDHCAYYHGGAASVSAALRQQSCGDDGKYRGAAGPCQRTDCT